MEEIYKIYVIYDNGKTFRWVNLNNVFRHHLSDYLSSNRFTVYSPGHKSNSRIVKKQNVLQLVNSDIRYVKFVMDILRKDYEFWKYNFKDFNKENYPEYFI